MPADARHAAATAPRAAACPVAGILAVVVGRMQRRVHAPARLQRARVDLARHGSANLVEDLAAVDEPFGPVRTSNVAVRFVDNLGFTGRCERMTPEAVMAMLRGFHGRMADCVFAHGGMRQRARLTVRGRAEWLDPWTLPTAAVVSAG